VDTEATHRLGLTGDAFLRGLVETLGLYQSKGDLAVQQRVVRQVDALFAALAQEFADLVAVVGKGRGGGGSSRVGRYNGRLPRSQNDGCCVRAAINGGCSFRYGQKRLSVGVVRIDSNYAFYGLTHSRSVHGCDCLFGLILRRCTRSLGIGGMIQGRVRCCRDHSPRPTQDGRVNRHYPDLDDSPLLVGTRS